MPETPVSNSELNDLDRVIALQKKEAELLKEGKRTVETLYSWTAPERDYSPKSRKWYIGVGFVAIVFIVISALTNNFVLIFAIIALIVVIYTVNTIPPRLITHQITNKGLYTFQTIFLWKNMLAFWISFRDHKYLMHLQYKGKSNETVYQEMILLLNKVDVEKVVTLMVPYVDYLGPNELGGGILTILAQGKYLPLLEIIGDKDVVTKDPNDSPLVLRRNV